MHNYMICSILLSHHSALSPPLLLDVSLAAAEIISDRNKKYTGYDSKQYEPPAKVGKHPSESAVGIAYLFSQDQFLLETYRNP